MLKSTATLHDPATTEAREESEDKMDQHVSHTLKDVFSSLIRVILHQTILQETDP